jgi:hypothetical protein
MELAMNILELEVGWKRRILGGAVLVAFFLI